MMDNDSTPKNTQARAPWFFSLLAALALVGVIAACWRKIDVSEVLFHLRAGQVIEHTDQIPNRDIFSATSSVGIWVYFEWLWASALAWAFAAGKWAGINGVTIGLATVTSALLIARNRLADTKLFESLVIVTAVMIALLPGFQPTPLTAALPLFALALIMTEARRWRWPMIAFPAVAAIWANVSISAPLVLLIPIARFIFPDGFDNRTIMPIRRNFFGLIIIAGLLGLSVNPHSIRAFTAWWHTAGVLASEAPLHLAAAFLDSAFLLQAALAIAMITLTVAGRAFTKCQMAAGTVLLASIVFISPHAVRFLLIFLAAPAATGLAVLLRRTWEGPASVRMIAGAALLIACVAWFACTAAVARLMPDAFGKGIRAHVFPETAAGRLAAIPMRATVFHQKKDAEYLTWRLWPDWKTSIDDRPGFYDHNFLSQYEKVWQGGQRWQELFQAWRVNAVVGNRDVSARYPKHNLFDELADSEEWQAVYWDSLSIVYLRKGIDVSATNFEPFRVLKPGLTWAEMNDRIKSPDMWRELTADLRRAVQDAPENTDAVEFLRRAQQHTTP